MVKWLFLIVVTFVAGCKQINKTRPEVVADVFNVPAGDTVNRYFNIGDAGINRFYETEVGAVLRRLHEPALHNYNGKGACIRLTWLRAFDNPVVIRLNTYNDACYIVIKELTMKKFEEDSCTIIKDTSFYVDNNAWKEAAVTLENKQFFSALTENETTTQGKDGVLWLLECRLKDKYNCIVRDDEGDLTSRYLQQYAAKLLQLAQPVISLKSSR